MFCKNCGVKIDSDANFCPNCGVAQSSDGAVNTITEDDYVSLTVKRNSCYSGCAVSVKIYINGVLQEKVKNGATVKLNIKPGIVDIKLIANSFVKCELKLRVRPKSEPVIVCKIFSKLTAEVFGADIIC